LARERGEPGGSGDLIRRAATDGGPSPYPIRPPYLIGFERMVLIREFEREIHRLFLKGGGARHYAPLGRAGGPCPWGVCMALEPFRLRGGHLPRDTATPLAKGTGPEAAGGRDARQGDRRLRAGGPGR